jgi:hypothetical protein
MFNGRPASCAHCRMPIELGRLHACLLRALDLAGLMAFLSKSQSRKLLSLMNRM